MSTGISIIIPTRNRETSLLNTLNALAVQDCEEAFEVIVVNDGGKAIAPLPTLAHPYCVGLVMINLPEPVGVCRARNIGVQTAQFSLLGFLDDDILPVRHWIRTLSKVFERHPRVGATVGQIQVTPQRGSLDRLRQSTYDQRHLEHYLKARRAYILAQFFHEAAIEVNDLWLVDYLSGGNCGIRKALFGEVGGFDEMFKVTQDREIAIRILQSHYYIIYNQALLVTHTSSHQPHQLLVGRFRSGMYNSLLKYKHPWLSPQQGAITLGFQTHLGRSFSDYCRQYGIRTALLAVASISTYTLGQIYGKYLWNGFPRTAAGQVVESMEPGGRSGV